MSIKEFLNEITLEELEELREEKLKLLNRVPTLSFSKIDFSNLLDIVKISRDFDDTIFSEWFNFSKDISQNEIDFLQAIIDDNRYLIDSYKEEDLKVKVITPILNRVKFLDFKNGFRDFYEEKLTYQTDRFTLTGTTDFFVSKGLEFAQKPFFFIQEFKRSLKGDDPRPQLLAELIAGVELNNWKTIRGAYIIGESWSFVILNRVDKDSYKYYVSRTFSSTNIEDLKLIYKNLLFVKNEIIEIIEREKN
jgi:hypothetical protein